MGLFLWDKNNNMMVIRWIIGLFPSYSLSKVIEHFISEKGCHRC
jgi:hypothetical protein